MNLNKHLLALEYCIIIKCQVFTFLEQPLPVFYKTIKNYIVQVENL